LVIGLSLLRGNRSLSSAGITAAVVGVIANLALYFAVHTLFEATSQQSWGPIQVDLSDLSTLRPVALIMAVTAAVLIFRFHCSVLRTLGACALLGLAAGLM
jgi:chromate transporter